MMQHLIEAHKPETESMIKVTGLKEAIAKHIKPGMSLHLAGGIGGPSAAICEIIRQFYGKKPGFTLIQSTITGHALNLLRSGLVQRIIFSACIDISTSSRPSRIMQKIWANKEVKAENWSLLSLQQRLMAGALGLRFLPTRSVGGSDIAAENCDSYRQITDPFNGKGKAGLVKSLNPDISIIHGCAADRHGNTVLPVPYGDDIWGSLASKNGVLVTVEKILHEREIHKYAALVKIPGYMVRAVSLAPLGMHPFSLANPGLQNFSGYEADIRFLSELHGAMLDRIKHDAWIKRWVLDCGAWKDYRNMLGRHRIASLRYEGGKLVAFRQPASSVAPRMQQQDLAAEQMMLITAAREIVASIVKSGYKLMLTGAGSRAIAVFMAYHQLRRQKYNIELISGNGQLGYEPQPGEISTQSIAAIYTSKMLTDTITAHGVFVAGAASRCLSVIGAGQIDRYGNINSTLTSEGKFLVGSGGANDSANAPEVILILNQDRDRFVEKLPYITGRGDNVSTVISSMGIFKKAAGRKELRLTACLPDAGLPLLKDRIERIKNNCGWPLKLVKHVHDMEMPSRQELKLLESLRNTNQ